jgi:serine protease Do
MNKKIKWLLIGLTAGVLISASLLLIIFSKFSNKREIKIVDEESVVTQVVERATPSVVTISVKEIDGVIKDVGSGFIVTKDGFIVTNKHVVAEIGLEYEVIIGKDEVVVVKNIYRDPLNDLAILYVEKNNLNTVELGDSDYLKVGQSVIAIGTALGEFRSTVTTGVISGLGRGITAGSTIGVEKLEDVIQTDAAINPGNSGGPLFNSAGQVIGVNVAVSASGQNIGFALPINLIKESINYFRETGEFERPYLGVSYKMVKQQEALKNKIVSGAWVQQVADNSPAYKAGIVNGDFITKIDGKNLIDSDNGDLVKEINKKKIGETIKVTIWREKKELTLDVLLEQKKN